MGNKLRIGSPAVIRVLMDVDDWISGSFSADGRRSQRAPCTHEEFTTSEVSCHS
jgi:hypothetical protein